MTHPAAVWCGPSTAKGSEWRAAAIASTSWSRALHSSPMTISCRGLNYRRVWSVPDFFCVFGDCSVGGEPADIGGVENARAHPTVPVAPGLVDLHLYRPIGVEVGADHEIIMMGECIDEAAITSDVIGREHAGGDFVERLAQDSGRGDVFSRIDALGSRRADLRGCQAKDEDVVITHH